MNIQTAAYGTWKSPITSEAIVAGSIGLGPLALDLHQLYWTEARPTESGRNALCQVAVNASAAGTGEISLISEVHGAELNGKPFNVRTRVHEYGGGAYLIHEGIAYVVNYGDQRVYQIGRNGVGIALTPEMACRYADFVMDGRRDRLIAIGEDHRSVTPESHEPKNELIAIALDPTISHTVLASGHDFYASPALSPDGKYLVWLTWDHPRMPWEGTELWMAEVLDTGALSEPTLIAGGLKESIFQPQWSPDGRLYFVSDRTGWWNLYRWQAGNSEPLCPKEAEFGLPQWVFGMSTYGFRSAQELICTYSENGVQKLSTLNLDTLALTDIPTPFTSIAGLQVSSSICAFLGGSATQPTVLVTLDLATLAQNIVRQATELKLDARYLSVPEAIEFPTDHGLTAHGFYYPPTNPEFQADGVETPPLLVKSHGGPTAATSASFDLRVQYWTSRGFGVLDVNYGGSTGYGRAYRQRLEGQWGVVDVNDCANGAKYLASQGRVDGDRLVIAGSSAGGYTTLAALAFTTVFKAGASYYGVSDLKVLAEDTHKFESRYLDSLVGAYPAEMDLYDSRSPINAIDRLSCPIIFLQGDEDKIVPPNQAERMVDALKDKGLPVAYILFKGEQHGFRKAENIRRAIDSEFYFYSRVFGFEPADKLPEVEIANL